MDDDEEPCSANSGISGWEHVTAFLKRYRKSLNSHWTDDDDDTSRFSIMVQGKTKGLQMKGPNARHAHKAAANTKKGQRAIAPKKAGLVKQAKMQQVSSTCLSTLNGGLMFLSQSLSAKISKSIERQMVDAASSGKLTIMKNTISPE